MYQFQTTTAFCFAVSHKYLVKHVVLYSWDKTRIAKHQLRHNLRNSVLTNFPRLLNADSSVAFFSSKEQHSSKTQDFQDMMAQKGNKCVHIRRMQLKEIMIYNFFFKSYLFTQCWNQSVATCSIFVQQNWQHAHVGVLITFHCMFMTMNFHSQKLKFPMSKCLPLAQYFSGGEVVSDKISSKNPKELRCDLVTPTSRF